MEIEKDTDLPRNLVKKIVKAKVSQVQASTGAQQGRDIQVNKDALLAFSESAKVPDASPCGRITAVQCWSAQ